MSSRWCSKVRVDAAVNIARVNTASFFPYPKRFFVLPVVFARDAETMIYEKLMQFARDGSFRCRPGCTKDCAPDDCLAHRQAIQQYERVVQRVVDTEDSLKRLQERYEALLSEKQQWLSERVELMKLIPAKTARELPGASRSPTSPAKKRRAHSPEREVSSKRQRIEPPSAPAPSPAPTPTAAAAQTPTPSAAPVPVMGTKFPAPAPPKPASGTAPRIPGSSPLRPGACPQQYLTCLWATARKVTKKQRRKVVNKHDIMSALCDRADIVL
ncbi:hypothetical protein CDAR_517601 [Caerostris darwini]|uniref:Uncharacterized protein n=1 Tax=Caerostris darwini TaxID=1538125 RepID=A0AAV4PJL3_9ARAC|nr:hypothetical protein CDAR_517601 [Caerostris darwini]